MRGGKKKSIKLWLKIPLTIILLLVLGVGIYAFTVYNHAKKTVNDKMHNPVESVDLNVTQKEGEIYRTIEYSPHGN